MSSRQVSEKNDGDGVRSGGGIKARVTSAVKKAPSAVPITPVTSRWSSV